MAWANAGEMWDAIEPTVMNAWSFGYASCATELQAEAINRLGDAYDQVSVFWEDAVEGKNELDANYAFVVLHLIVGISRYLWVWIDIKQDEMHSAWDSLICAQNEFRLAMRLMPDLDWIAHALRIVNTLEIVAFPQQQFVSPSVLYEYAHCSICGKVCGECDHLTGRLYMGRMCCQIPQNISPGDHVALVDYPEDKRCRRNTREENGRKICTLTKRDMGESPPPNDDNTVWGGECILLVASSPSVVARADLIQLELDKKEKYQRKVGTVTEDKVT